MKNTGEYGEFIPGEYIRCALVATTPYNNPLRVPLDAVLFAE